MSFFSVYVRPRVLFTEKLHSLQVFGSNWFGCCCIVGGAVASDGASDGVGGKDIAMLSNSLDSESIFKASFGGWYFGLISRSRPSNFRFPASKTYRRYKLKCSQFMHLTFLNLFVRANFCSQTTEFTFVSPFSFFGSQFSRHHFPTWLAMCNLSTLICTLAKYLVASEKSALLIAYGQRWHASSYRNQSRSTLFLYRKSESIPWIWEQLSVPKISAKRVTTPHGHDAMKIPALRR